MRFKIFVLFVLFSPLLQVVAQRKPAPQPVKQTAYPDINYTVYKNAITLKDYSTAIHALHYIIAANPGGAPYADTLAVLYAQTGQYLQAGLLADIELGTRGYTDLRMEIKAGAAKNLNNPALAIDCYNTLYEKTKNPAYGFEKLQLEYEIKRLGESVATANQLLKAMPANDSTNLQVAKPDGKTTQVVPFRAGVLNLQATAFIELNQKENAMQALLASLQIAPDYEMAKTNLKVVQALADKK